MASLVSPEGHSGETNGTGFIFECIINMLSQTVGADVFSSSTRRWRQEYLSEFKDSRVCRASSETDKVIKKKRYLEDQTNNKKDTSKTGKHPGFLVSICMLYEEFCG